MMESWSLSLEQMSYGKGKIRMYFGAGLMMT
ncbi:hypothetical protein P609_15285 [Comamonas thiooxydans]|nr:hypothetical protein P609_15285 [Comamonas thiooxydans]